MEVKAEPPASAPPDPGKRAGRIGIASLVFVLVVPGALTWLWSRPRPAEPTEMPALVLPPEEVAAQRRADEAAAASVPRSAATDARLEAYRAHNRGELTPNDRPSAAHLRRRQLSEALAAVVAEHGEAARTALRADDLENAMELLEGGEPSDRAAELGALVAALERYGMVQQDRQVAPTFVVRTIFKARWNAAHERPLTEGLSDIERRAYWGWLALEADEAPPDQRLEALARYGEAGGARVAEARAILLLRAGRPEDAAASFGEAYAERPSFRLRNHQLAALLVGAESVDVNPARERAMLAPMTGRGDRGRP